MRKTGSGAGLPASVPDPGCAAPVAPHRGQVSSSGASAAPQFLH
jgi:hypothetical protein